MANGETFDELRKLSEEGSEITLKGGLRMVMAGLADLADVRSEDMKELKGEIKVVKRWAIVALVASLIALLVPELRDSMIKAIAGLL